MIFYPETFGAVGDGVHYDTLAVQQALDECAKQGGTVQLSGGKTYLCASLFLGSHTELNLAEGSVLLAGHELSDYFRPDQPARGGNESYVGTPVLGKPSYVFLYAYDQEDVAVTGGGRVDGNSTCFVSRQDQYYVTGDFYPRPTLVYFEKCRHVSFKDATFGNAPFWTIHLAGCDDCDIGSVRILNPLDTANSDGIDVDHSRDVRIHDCHVACADDCICMKNNLGSREYHHTKNVVVTGCTLISTSAALKIGTEGVDDFENIIFADCCISASNRGISVQIRDKGCVRNVVFERIFIETRRFAPQWWGCAEPIAITARDRDHGVPCGSISDVRFRDIRCESENGILIYSDDDKISDISFENVRLKLVKTSKWPVDLYDLRPAQDEPGLLPRRTEPLFIHGAHDIRMKDVTTIDLEGRREHIDQRSF